MTSYRESDEVAKLREDVLLLQSDVAALKKVKKLKGGVLLPQLHPFWVGLLVAGALISAVVLHVCGLYPGLVVTLLGGSLVVGTVGAIMLQESSSEALFKRVPWEEDS